MAPAEQTSEIAAFARERKRKCSHREIVQRGLERTISSRIGSLGEMVGVGTAGVGEEAPSAASVFRRAASSDAGDTGN
jgi:hypothetical protein